MREVIAENYLCFCALLEMIITDGQKIKITQYKIAEKFGVTIPYNYKINVKNVNFSCNTIEHGVHITESALNDFFCKEKINLHAKYLQVNPYEELFIDEYENKNLRLNKYIIYTYSYGYLFHFPDAFDVGHVALLQDVISDHELLIYDPGPKNSGLKNVNRHEMYDAIRYRHGGVYLLEKFYD